MTLLESSHIEARENLSVAAFFEGKSVFVTGGTGFLGKVLLEKLLRSCPKLKNIYLLVRAKRGQDIPSRLHDLTNSPVFDAIRNKRPEDLKKIVPIEGDIKEPDLGISVTDQDTLCREVSVVFHSAATLKLDEHLKLAVAINVQGTKRLVDLCHRMVKLQVIVHASTAYCNCDRQTIDECVYPQYLLPEHVTALVQTLPEELIDKLTPILYHKFIDSTKNTLLMSVFILILCVSEHYVHAISAPT